MGENRHRDQAGMTKKNGPPRAIGKYTDADLSSGLKIVDQLARKDGNALVAAVAEYMVQHGLSATSDVANRIPTSTSH